MKVEDFISAKFFEDNIPKDKKYLKKYFTTKLQKVFLNFFLLDGNLLLFNEQTGFDCTKRFLFLQKRRYKKIVEMRENAKKNLDLALLEKIERGKINTTGI